MQHAEIKRDLLESSARHETDEGAFGKSIAEPGNGEPRRRLGREAASIERDDEGAEPALLEGLAQALPMPIPPIAEKDDARVGARRHHAGQEKERESTASSMRPASKLLPDLSAVTVTMAGLNNMRSMA